MSKKNTHEKEVKEVIEHESGYCTVIMQDGEKEKLGPKSVMIIQKVAENTYPSARHLAKAVGPNGSLQYGYNNIYRVERDYWFRDESHEEAEPRGDGVPVLTKKGEQVYYSLH